MKNVTFAIDRLRSSLATVSSRKLFAVLTLASALLYFAGLNARYLMDSDEPRVAGISTELMISGNWLEPHLNGKSFLEKPPLYFWADAMCIKIADQLGLEGPMAAKLPSAVSAFLGVLLLFWLLRAMRYSPLTCMLGGFFLATSAQYWRNGRKCIVDTFLCFFILVAMTAFYKIASTRKSSHRVCFFVMYALGIGGAVMSKGLVGAAIPGIAICAFLAADDFLVEHKFTWKRWLLAVIGGGLGFLPMAIWLLMLYKESGYEAFRVAFWVNNIGRFTGGHAEHVEPFYYYLRKLPELFQPWMALIPFALYWAWTQVKSSAKQSRELLFMASWLLLPFLLLMVASGKRGIYMLPLFPAAALLAGVFAASLLEGKIKVPKFNIDIILNGLLYILPALPAVFGIVFGIINLVHGRTGLAVSMSFVTGIVFTFFAYYFMREGKFMLRYAMCLIFSLVLVMLQVDTDIYAPKNAERSYRNYFTAVKKIIKSSDDNPVLLMCNPEERFRGASVYYLQRDDVPVISSLEQARQYKGRVLIMVAQERLPEGAMDPKKVENLLTVEMRKDHYMVLTPKK